MTDGEKIYDNLSKEMKSYENFLGEESGILKNEQMEQNYSAYTEWKEGGIYLTDLHSTNGTFQNGIRILPERPYLLQSGDEVAFADVKYIFQ